MKLRKQILKLSKKQPHTELLQINLQYSQKKPNSLQMVNLVTFFTWLLLSKAKENSKTQISSAFLSELTSP